MKGSLGRASTTGPRTFPSRGGCTRRTTPARSTSGSTRRPAGVDATNALPLRDAAAPPCQRRSPHTFHGMTKATPIAQPIKISRTTLPALWNSLWSRTRLGTGTCLATRTAEPAVGSEANDASVHEAPGGQRQRRACVLRSPPITRAGSSLAACSCRPPHQMLVMRVAPSGLDQQRAGRARERPPATPSSSHRGTVRSWPSCS